MKGDSSTSIYNETLCDAKNKYFLTNPFWSHGVRLKQSNNIDRTYMDETAVRARAGILHMMAWSTLLCSFVVPEWKVIIYIGPFIIFDMLMGILFGLTPFCPSGVIGTIISWNIKPIYKPSAPKRFAWSMGIALAAFCISWRIYFGPHLILKISILICCILTFLESSLGFCVGCYLYIQIKKCINMKQKHGQTDNNTKSIDLKSEIIAIKRNIDALTERLDNVAASASISSISYTASAKTTTTTNSTENNDQQIEMNVISNEIAESLDICNE